MCGIVSVIGKINAAEEKLFRQLLVLDSIRGEDSTGVASAGPRGDVIVAKSVGDPFQLFETTNFSEMMRRKNAVLIGHNRAATTGKVVRKNAHPFEFNSLVGVHNGTLRNKHVLEDAHKFDTDSEALYNMIDKKGLDEAIEKVNGAYSLVWYDKDNHTINFLRNDERPMNILFSKDKKTMFCASEAWMLTALLARDRYEFGAIETLPVDTHFSFQIPEADKEFEKAKVRAVKPSPFSQTATSNTSQVSQTTSVGTRKRSKYPKAKEFLDKFRVKGKNITLPEMDAGDVVEGRVISWSRVGGAYFVTLFSADHKDLEFRCYLHSEAACKDIVGERMKGEISRTTTEKGKVVYKISPETLVSADQEDMLKELDNVEVKADNRGVLITKDTFDKRYSNCQWCSSPVVFEENWTAFTDSECLCEACTNDQEIAQYIPELRKSCH